MVTKFEDRFGTLIDMLRSIKPGRTICSRQSCRDVVPARPERLRENRENVDFGICKCLTITFRNFVCVRLTISLSIICFSMLSVLSTLAAYMSLEFKVLVTSLSEICVCVIIVIAVT